MHQQASSACVSINKYYCLYGVCMYVVREIFLLVKVAAFRLPLAIALLSLYVQCIQGVYQNQWSRPHSIQYTMQHVARYSYQSRLQPFVYYTCNSTYVTYVSYVYNEYIMYYTCIISDFHLATSCSVYVCGLLYCFWYTRLPLTIIFLQ